MNFSIRAKFLIVMTGLLTLCLGAYLLMATKVFSNDKTQLVYDLNRSQVSNLSNELETQFSGLSDKLKLFALLPPALQGKMAEDLFSEGSEIVSVGIYKSRDESGVRTYTQPKFLETYGLDKDYFTRLVQKTPIPFSEILHHGEDVWNASSPEGPPLIGYGRLVVLQDASGFPVEQWAVVGFVKMDRFLDAVSIVGLSQIYVANRRGEVLIHPDAKRLLSRPSVSEDPLFQAALETKTKISLVDRELKDGRVLAAYAKGYNGQIYVVAKASESEVFRVVREFEIRTLLFGSIVLTLVILAAFLLSRPLTENIEILVERMEKVRSGDLSTAIRLKGRDETVTLAATFNQMIRDLKDSREALEAMNRELDQKVKERTAQLEEQNKKVKEVQEALIRTTRLASVGEIAGRTAHEVLNPLTILLTRVGLMKNRLRASEADSRALFDEIREAWTKEFREGGLEKLTESWRSPSQVSSGQNLFQEDIENLAKVSAEWQEENRNLDKDIEFVKQEAERIGKIINAMRRLGHLQSEMRPHSLHAILSDCCHIMADLFEQRGFHLLQEFGAERFTVSVDRDELIQAVTNLLRNSLQALDDRAARGLPAGQAKAILRTRDLGGQIQVEIEDNGVGIPTQYQAQLFESSFTTKSPEEGTGLGLGISRRFVRGFGGDIEFVSSEPGAKTIFRIRLPLQESEDKKGAVA